MAKRSAPEITPELKAACRKLVYLAATTYAVPPAYITAHTRAGRSDAARKWVMREMISGLGMRRYQVAEAFGRDIRRVRRTVLGV